MTVSDEDDPRPLIMCDSQEDVSGKKNVTLSIAFHTTFISMTSSKVFSQCTKGYFGRNGYNGTVGEYCEACPVGAECDGRGSEPKATAGFYIGYADFTTFDENGTVVSGGTLCCDAW